MKKAGFSLAEEKMKMFTESALNSLRALPVVNGYEDFEALVNYITTRKK
jgi:geranylgeranyl pyrophosphate synthase